MKKGLAVLIMLSGILLSMYPFLSNCLNERAAKAEIRYIQKQAETISTYSREKCLWQARTYNAGLAEEKTELRDSFDSKNGDDQEGVPYEDILFFDSSGIMGFLEIPCIQVELPIYHGTSESVLQKGVGHLKGSSVPVGGQSTHAVLTGHTGLNKARLFTDLTSLEKGDLFFITVLNEKLAYCVDEIHICLPEDTKALRIVRGEDHVTLVTCTPYGVNDHRLLIRGTRTAYTENMDKRAAAKKVDSLWMASYKRALAIGAGILAFLMGLLWMQKRIRRLQK